MFWTSQIAFALSTIVTLTRGSPSASGWQDNSIPPSSPGSTKWQPSSSVISGWQVNSIPSSSRSSGWLNEGAGWKSGSSGWQSRSSGGLNDGSTHNFYDGSVSNDYVSRYHGPIALPVVLPDGTLADTPEVAAAKAAHLAALEKAKTLWYGPKDDGSYDPHKYEEHDDHGSSSHGESSGLHNNLFMSPGLHEDHSYSSLHSDTHGPQNVPYNGPLATTAVLPSGYLADTPAIEAARAAHLTAVYKAEQEADKWKPSEGWKQWK